MTLVGRDGPAVVVEAAVADLIAPPLRAWLRQAEAAVGRDQRHSLSRVADVLADLERAAAAYRAAMERDGAAWAAMSASGSPRGHFRPAVPGSGDGVGVRCVSEAADLLGVTPRHVRRLVAAGVLAAERPGRDLLIDAGSLDAELARREAQ